ncbi:MAG: 50S ribosomal protein L15 [Candidatus Dadabacteria bacterium]|nr:50S ribosomal protein L15 [Candidatus Dadabacteria bacterium]
MLNKLAPPEGATKKRKRLGRGVASHGKTSGRGHKGQNSRSGGGVPPWFEGGQSPLKLRVPKRGFHNPFKTVYDVLNVGELNNFKDGEEVSTEQLREAGLISGKRPVKILGQGELLTTITVKANRFSKTAVAKLEERGGKAEVL